MKMKVVIAAHPWALYHLPCPYLPFCWYVDAGPGYRAAFRDDGLIYRAGFRTREAAEDWAKKEGIL